MKLIGLTGGIAMGKSTAGEIIRKKGFPVLDTDDIAREVVAPGQPASREIRDSFGEAMFDQGGNLVRGKLAERVFSDETARKQLEGILHPRIRERWLAQAKEWRQSNALLGVVIIPLLFETGAEEHFDAVVCVACSTSSQTQRLKERGLSDEQIARRNAAQLSIDQKIDRSNYVVWTDTTLPIVQEQLDELVKELA
jgi:dephospho-CoA kinase